MFLISIDSLFATPSEHLRPIILMMKYLGIWGIESDNCALKTAYAFASLFSRWGIPYLSALFQTVSLFYLSNITVNLKPMNSLPLDLPLLILFI